MESSQYEIEVISFIVNFHSKPPLTVNF